MKSLLRLAALDAQRPPPAFIERAILAISLLFSAPAAAPLNPAGPDRYPPPPVPEWPEHELPIVGLDLELYWPIPAPKFRSDSHEAEVRLERVEERAERSVKLVAMLMEDAEKLIRCSDVELKNLRWVADPARRWNAIAGAGFGEKLLGEASARALRVECAGTSWLRSRMAQPEPIESGRIAVRQAQGKLKGLTTQLRAFRACLESARNRTLAARSAARELARRGFVVQAGALLTAAVSDVDPARCVRVQHAPAPLISGID